MEFNLLFVFLILHLLNNAFSLQQEIFANKVLSKIPFKTNHNLKLVKLKKVRKVYSDSQNQLDIVKDENDIKTIVNLDTKYNVVNQKPKSFLLNEISDNQNLISIENSNYGSNEKKIKNKNIFESNKNKLKFPQSDKLKILKKIDFNKENEKISNKNLSQIKKKNLLSINFNDVSKKSKEENLIHKKKISNKLNSKKIILTTTSKPISLIKKKKDLNNVKNFEKKNYITLPPTSKKTTVTYKPYIYSTVTTNLPILRVRKSNLKLKESTDNQKDLDSLKNLNDKKFANKNFITKKNDLDSINSIRKYSKIKFSNGLNKSKPQLNLNKSEIITTTINPISFTSKPFVITSTPTNKILTTTISLIKEKKESSLKNLKDNSKIVLFATRKKPLTQRFRSVNLTQKEPSLESKLLGNEITTQKTINSSGFTDKKNYLKKESFQRTKTRSLPDYLNNKEKKIEITTISSTTLKKNVEDLNQSNFNSGKIDISSDLKKISSIDDNFSNDLTLDPKVISLSPRKSKWAFKNSLSKLNKYSNDKPTYLIPNHKENKITNNTNFKNFEEKKLALTSTIKPLIEAYVLKTKNLNMIDESEPLESLYQKTKPKAFLLNENFSNKNNMNDLVMKNSIDKLENYQDYQEPRIHKETNLVPQTYFLSTIRPDVEFSKNLKPIDLKNEKPSLSENNGVLGKNLKNIIFLRNKEYIKPILNYPFEEKVQEVGKISKKSIKLFQKQAPIPYFAPEKKNELFDSNKEKLKANEVNEFQIKNLNLSLINKKDNLSSINKNIDNFEPQKTKIKFYEEKPFHNYKTESDSFLMNKKINNDSFKNLFPKGFSDQLKMRLSSFKNQAYIPNYLKNPDYTLSEKPILKQDFNKKDLNKLNEVDFIKSDQFKLNLIKNLNKNFKENENKLPLKETLNQNIFKKPLFNKNFNINKIPAKVFYDKFNSQPINISPKSFKKSFEENKFLPINYQNNLINNNVNIPSNLFNKPKNNYFDKSNEENYVSLKNNYDDNLSNSKRKNFNRNELSKDDYNKVSPTINNYNKYNLNSQEFEKYKPTNENYNKIEPVKENYNIIEPVVNNIEPLNENYNKVGSMNENYDPFNKNLKPNNYYYKPKNAGHFNENKKLNNLNKLNKNFDFKSQFLDQSLPEMTLLQHSIIQHDVPVKNN